MSQSDTAHAWWSRLRHQGLLLSPVVMVERYADAPPAAPFHVRERLRAAYTRLLSSAGKNAKADELDQAAILTFVDAFLENFAGHSTQQIARQHSIPDKLTVAVRIGTRSETIKPHRVLFADDTGAIPALLIMADTSPHVGRGRGRTTYAQFLELLRGTGHRLGLLTNGQQFRLIYAGLDFESWCEWETDRWFDDGEGTEELLGLRQLLAIDSLKSARDGVSGLLDAVEESRKRQADLSSVLRENVRQAVELLLEDVSTANRVDPNLFNPLVSCGERTLTDTEAHEALLQATVRVVMRLVVCLFAESRQLLPTNDPIYSQSYGVRSLYELLDQAARHEGGTHVLFNRQTAWPRLMALFRLIHNGSSHGAFPLRPYGGVLFRPGDQGNGDAVSRALHILEHAVAVGDATIFYVLKKLLRGPLPVIRGRSKTYVEGPVDYTDLRTEFIGLIYEGLLDYRLKRTDEKIGPQIFLNLGREPVLPLTRLTDMLQHDRKALKDLLATLGKEKAGPTAADEAEDSDEEADEPAESSEDEATSEDPLETQQTDQLQRGGDYLDAVESAKAWAKEAVVLAGIVPKQKKRESDAEYQSVIESAAHRLIRRVVSTGEFYLVRAGNTRKGTGTFYTRPQLAVPTVHRTLQPLCYDKADDGTQTPKTPEDILGLKICDPACGSASFLVAALHYVTDSLYKSLCHHRRIDDPVMSGQITLPFGRPRTSADTEQIVPFPPDDPQRGDTFPERIRALLRRHVVERCIYGVDINALAVELARVSLWVETLDPELPFSFLDHKIKVGNALVGCWLDRVEDYPIKAWEREGGDGPNGERTGRIETFLKGPKEKYRDKKGKEKERRSGVGRIRQELRDVHEGKFGRQSRLFAELTITKATALDVARADYTKLHDFPLTAVDERERYYKDCIRNGSTLRTLKGAMDEWCATWFWPTDEESLRFAPTPLTYLEHSPQKKTIIDRITADLKFFHWETEFPDVFTASRSGFDGLIGNPPWDVMKPSSQEFFVEYDPLYRTYEKQKALQRQHSILQELQNGPDLWADYNARFKAMSNWTRNVAQPSPDTPPTRNAKKVPGGPSRTTGQQNTANGPSFLPYRLQGSADLNLYKLFAEMFWFLLRHSGRLGIVVPTGLYSDLGTRALRKEFFDNGSIDFLYAFQNERKIFAEAHHSIKQVAVFATRGGTSERFLARFRMGVGNSPNASDIPGDVLERDSLAIKLTMADIQLLSPGSDSLVEVSSPREFSIIHKIHARCVRIAHATGELKCDFTTEFHLTNDSKLFPHIDTWKSDGFVPNRLGHWARSSSEIALPVYQGRMLHQFDCARVAYVSGKGPSSIWDSLPAERKRWEPTSLMAVADFQGHGRPGNTGLRLGFRDVARSTDTRTMIAAVLPEFPCTNKVPLLRFPSIESSLLACGILNSLSFDFCLRTRLCGATLNWFIISDCPFPQELSAIHKSLVVRNVLRLNCIHPRFAPQWLYSLRANPGYAAQEWKQWWGVTDIDRLRLRLEIDAVVAEFYALEPDDFDWIVRDDYSDPKGFYRVDRNLPFRERLTGLAAAAFRALKEGKWSAETAANLSNDEFFDILGIPEMTNAEAARAKGEPGPLIFKRGGCHIWKPEEFTEDDPRYGWTWDHCRQDAIALLGSEQALEEYIRQQLGSETATVAKGAVASAATEAERRQMKLF